MPPIKGLSESSPCRRGSMCNLVGLLRTGQASQRGRRLRLTALVLAPTLISVCGSSAQAQAVGDRYSGEVYVQPAYRQAAGAGGPTLLWPGKTEASAPQPAAPSWGSPSSGYGAQRGAPAYGYAAQAYRSGSPMAYQAPITQQVAQTPAYQAPAYQPPSYQAPSYQAPGLQPPASPAPVAREPAQPARAYGAPPVMPWYQRYGVAESSSAPAPAAPPPAPQQAGAPQSIYDPPVGRGGAPAAAAGAPPAPPVAKAAPTATAANDGETARFYSLHRQYGLTPDPDPIPPQFFSQTADLSDPPGPSPVYKAATSSGGSTTSVHNVQSNDSTSTLGQP
jgi:hypothetical protein